MADRGDRERFVEATLEVLHYVVVEFSSGLGFSAEAGDIKIFG